MYKVQVLTNDPDRLLNWAAKKHLVEEDVLISPEGTGIMEHFQREELVQYPVRDFFKQAGRFVAIASLVASALLAVTVFLFTWLLGLVGLFSQYGLGGVEVIGLTLIGLFVSYRFSKTVFGEQPIRGVATPALVGLA